jgi:endonuclease-3
MTPPASWLINKQFGRDPFLQLISCLLSLRTKDTVSLPASVRLFAYATTPEQLITLDTDVIEKIIFPCVYYKQKARTIKKVSQQLLNDFYGKVPSSIKQLLQLHGVGRKTANLVLAEGFAQPALCVDVHVHRIYNRIGLVQTITPEETEYALTQILPKHLWREWNALLVMWGQNICTPRSPWCSKCPLFELCQRKDVEKSR